MPTPILIAARNEAENIERTLRSLPKESEPIVIPNGCNDDTVAIAEAFGARIVECKEEGKMPALQEGIRSLGRRALEPFILLDADARVLFPRLWIPAMHTERQKMPQETPAIVVGSMLITTQRRVGTAVVRNFRHHIRNHTTRTSTISGSFSGANMLMDLHKKEVLEGILTLPNVWPGVDRAMKDVLVSADHGGLVRKSMDPRTVIIREDERGMGLLDRLRLGPEASREYIAAQYSADAPPQSVSYDAL